MKLNNQQLGALLAQSIDQKESVQTEQLMDLGPGMSRGKAFALHSQQTGAQALQAAMAAGRETFTLAQELKRAVKPSWSEKLRELFNTQLETAVSVGSMAALVMIVLVAQSNQTLPQPQQPVHDQISTHAQDTLFSGEFERATPATRPQIKKDKLFNGDFEV